MVMGKRLGSVARLMVFGIAGFAAQAGAQPELPAGNAPAALAAADALRMQGNAADLRQAVEKYSEAAKGFQSAGDRQREARARFGLGMVYDSLSQKRDAIAS